jgi:hypothetical protein
MRIVHYFAITTFATSASLLACSAPTGSAADSRPVPTRTPFAVVPASAETQAATGIAEWDYYKALPGSGYGTSVVARGADRKILNVMRVAAGKDVRMKQPILKIRYNHSGGKLVYAAGKVIENTLSSEHLGHLQYFNADMQAAAKTMPYGCTGDVVQATSTGAATGIACAFAATTPITGPGGAAAAAACLLGLVNAVGGYISIEEDCTDPTTGQTTHIDWDITTINGQPYICDVPSPGQYSNCDPVDPQDACDLLAYGCDDGSGGAGGGTGGSCPLDDTSGTCDGSGGDDGSGGGGGSCSDDNCY